MAAVPCVVSRRWRWPLLALFLVSWSGWASCRQFIIPLNSTTRVELDVHLGDSIKVLCPIDRYDNIIYLRTEEQLLKCNASAVPPDYHSGLTPYLNAGACVGPTVFSFIINITRTSEFLATTIPFQKGHTYHFTSFTDGSLWSAAMNPMSGGDCTRGLALIFHVIDPDQPPPSPPPPSSYSTPTHTPLATPLPTDKTTELEPQVGEPGERGPGRPASLLSGSLSHVAPSLSFLLLLSLI